MENGVDYLPYDYDNEEPTDEARTNEEVFEDFPPRGGARMINGKCVFFNEEGEDCQDESEEEDED